MTPNSIRTGRGLSSRTMRVVATAGVAVPLVQGGADRVALVASLAPSTTAALDGTVGIGVLVEGVFTSLTTLSAGHPTCYLSVDKIGVAITPAILVLNACTADIAIGVTDVRQTQEFT